MTDLYVYYFVRRGPAGENILSKRRATLDAIKDRGEAVMDSQIVVDHAEVDGNGFLIGNISSDSHPMDERWAQIRSLVQRANSRDSEAGTLSKTSEGARIYMLSLESRELRKQAKRLKEQRTDSNAAELCNQIDLQVFVQFGGDSTTA